MRARWAAPLLLSALLAAPSWAHAARPSLVVLVVIDQLASDYLHRWGPILDGGLAEMMRRGAYYSSVVHAQASTATGPGHATLATGAWPSTHGIFTNAWMDPKDGHLVPCVGSNTEPGPQLLLAPTLADQLRVATHGRGKVVSIALKDRAAILMAGQRPTLAAWYSSKLGAFTSGRWYGETKDPEWLSRLSLEQNAAQSFGRPWKRLRDDLDYVRLADADDQPFEGDIPGLGRVFPRVYGKGLEGPDERWLASYPATPASLETLFEVVRRAVEAESLGRHDTPDFLAIGVSTLDYAGHYYGPFAQETFDVLLRTDRELGALMRWIDRQNGGRTVWVVTGDHGIAPAPESLAALGLDAQRVNSLELNALVDPALKKLTAPGRAPLKLAMIDPPMIYLSHDDPAADRPKLRRAAAEALRAHPRILEVYPADEVDRFTEPFRPLYTRARVTGREPDLFYRGRAFDLIESKYATGSNHGSPYNYDTHVPVLIAGPGVVRGKDARPYPITAVAPTIAAFLGMTPPAAATEPPLPAAP